MKRAIAAAFLIAIPAVILMQACSTDVTLEQKCESAKNWASFAITESYHDTPTGDWKDEVCALSATILKALDGDSMALMTVGGKAKAPITMIMVGSQATIDVDTSKILISLLLSDAIPGIPDIWKTRIKQAITLVEPLIADELTMPADRFRLVHAFFEGLNEGCQAAGQMKESTQ